MIYGHGDDIYNLTAKVIANFSTNVWYGADERLLRKLLEEKAEVVLHYPEPDAASFRKVVAAYHGLSPEHVVVGNGATELFYLVAHAFAGVSTVIPVPSFTEYEDACALYGHRLTFPGHSEVSAIPEGSRLMFICNPNNPDGRIWTEKEINNLLTANPDMILVVDESFIHFAPAARTVCSWLGKFSNLLVIRSMMKSYAIPGLRLGYMLGEPELIRKIVRFKQPWTVNALAIEIGKYLLEHGEKLLPDAMSLLERQRCFSMELSRVAGYYPQLSGTSFFLVKTDYPVGALKCYLLERHGILIRDASNFRGLEPVYFRVNTLTGAKNRLLTDALKSYAG